MQTKRPLYSAKINNYKKDIQIQIDSEEVS
jgi:hypothetical protein